MLIKTIQKNRRWMSLFIWLKKSKQTNKQKWGKPPKWPHWGGHRRTVLIWASGALVFEKRPLWKGRAHIPSKTRCQCGHLFNPFYPSSPPFPPSAEVGRKMICVFFIKKTAWALFSLCLRLFSLHRCRGFCLRLCFGLGRGLDIHGFLCWTSCAWRRHLNGVWNFIHLRCNEPRTTNNQEITS